MTERIQIVEEAIEQAKADQNEAFAERDYDRVNRIELFLRVLKFILERMKKAEE